MLVRVGLSKTLGAKAVDSAAVVVVDALTDARGAPAHALTARPVSVFVGEYHVAKGRLRGSSFCTAYQALRDEVERVRPVVRISFVSSGSAPMGSGMSYRLNCAYSGAGS